MKRNSIGCWLLGFFSLALLGACSKDSSSITGPATKTELISKAPWITTKAGIDENLNGKLDPAEEMMIQECEKDDQIVFAANKTGYLGFGTNLCNGQTPGTINFNWSFMNNETVVAITVEGMSFNMNLLGLTASEMIIGMNDVNSQGQPTQLINHFRH